MTMKTSKSIPFIGGVPKLRCHDIEVMVSQHQFDTLNVSLQCRKIVLLVS